MKQIQISGPQGPVARAWLADHYFTRLRGLIGRRLTPEGGLLLSPCAQIHTCLMSQAIDAVYLDRERRVLRIDHSLPPGRFCKSARQGRYVLELFPGQALACGLSIGDQLRW